MASRKTGTKVTRTAPKKAERKRPGRPPIGNPQRQRVLMIDDERWEIAVRESERNGQSISEYVRNALDGANGQPSTAKTARVRVPREDRSVTANTARTLVANLPSDRCPECGSILSEGKCLVKACPRSKKKAA